jgi:hypothetical protein
MEDIVRSQLRVPLPLYDRLKEAAERAGRSLNAEIVFRLARSFETSGEAGAAELAEKLSQPEHRADLEILLAAIQRISRKK